jgi:outer membrane receptor protein involved in Fe transport
MRNAQRAKDIVVPLPGGLGVGFADLFNAPRAHSYGAEAELDWRASKRLSARLALGLLRTKLVDAGADYAEFSGNEFGRSPHFSAAASVDWAATSQMWLSAQARHHSSYHSFDIDIPGARVGPATIVDARAEYRLRQFTLFAYARNLFDTFALIERFPGPPDEATAEDPRMIGVGLEARF